MSRTTRRIEFDNLDQASWVQKLAGRFLWRLRWVLLPIGVGLLVLPAGWMLALVGHFAGFRWVLAVAAVAVLVAAAWVGLGLRGSWDRTRAVITVALCYSFAALIAYRPGQPGLYAVWALVVPLAASVLWWWAPQTRRMVEFDRLAEQLARTGAKLVRHEPHGMGTRLRIRVNGGAEVKGLREQLADTFDVPTSRVVVTPDPATRRSVDVLLLDAEMFDGPETPHPALTGAAGWEPGSRSVYDPAPLGVHGDRTVATVNLVNAQGGRHWLLLGETRSGKSGTQSCLIAHLAACRDAVIWGSNVAKGGSTYRPWADVLDWLVTTDDATEAMLDAALRVIDARGERLSGGDHDVWQATPAEPWLFVLIEELPALLSRRPDLADKVVDIAQLGGGVGVSLQVVAQGGHFELMPTTLRQQIGGVIVHRMKADALRTALPAAYGVLDMGLFVVAGTAYYQEGNLEKFDGCVPERSYALYEPTDKRKVAGRYRDHRPRLDAVSLRAAGAEYASREVTVPDTPMPAPRQSRGGDQGDARQRVSQLASDALAGLAAPTGLPDESIADAVARVEPEPVDGDPVAVRTRERLVELLRDAGGDGAAAGVLGEQLAAAGLPSSASTVLRRLTELRDQGQAEAVGHGRGTRWRLVVAEAGVEQ